ncbi:M20 metallopeptidase family protein [Acetonema longum]|uniref:Amidohydrolase n=1 Tax=Acetonema longum DSM 6540 TaxID=1009370 RepID=F7NG35_9FIRM|nr:M20 family metallopeptidase [Acetonema longum]EGO64953.1 amidohydrolase [Acetonema longum DSM 6540]
MEIDKDVQNMLPMLIDWRRDFHSHPELSGQERRSSAVIQKALDRMGIEYQTFTNHPGVVGIVRGKQPGPAVALRADMDALPIHEDSETPYRSRYDGVMHACGHDAHMAILLGAAKLLRQKADFAGTVKLIFQPAEEAAPVGGAQAMMDDGALDNPAVDAIFGLHVWPELPTGEVGIRSGRIMAASDRFTVKLFGKGAHGAMPHQGIDAVAMMSDAIQGFNHIMNRQISPLEVATLNIGTIAAGERYNVLPKEVVLEGTVRTLGESVRQEIPVRMKRALEGVAQAHGGRFDLKYDFGYPGLKNWEEPTSFFAQAAQDLLGESGVHTDLAPVLGGEDFARYLTRIPGAFLWLGCVSAGREQHPLHNSRFDIDESCLLTGAILMYRTALNALSYYQTHTSQRGDEARLYV